MTDFILGVFEITIGMSLFIALLLLGLKLFGGKFTAKCRYIIWALVMLRLAIPFSFGLLPTLIEIPIDTELVQSEDLSSVPSENTDPITSVQPSDPGDVAVNPTVPNTPVSPNMDPVNPDITPILPGEQAEPVIPSEPVIETPTEQSVSLRQILDIAGIVYLIGAAGFLVWSLVSYFIYTRKILHSAKAADNRTQQIFSTICKKYGIKKQPTLLVASGIHSPAAFGIFRRKIVLPDIAFTEKGLVGTLAHEVTHCKRGDLYMKLVELIACSLNWFNPLVHIAAFKCEMEMELSCDEKVLSGSSEAARAAYADVMLDIIRRCRRNRGALTTHFNPKKSAVTARFKNILYGSGKRRGRILIGVCLVLCILAGAFVACQTGDDLPDDIDYAEGIYIKDIAGADMVLIDGTSPCTFWGADGVVIEGLTDGDRIRIGVREFLDSSPMQAEVYSIEKLSDGTIDDIDPAVLDSLHEIGWIDADNGINEDNKDLPDDSGQIADGPKHSYTSDIDNFIPPEADSLPKITVLTTGKVLLTYETEEKLPLVYFGQGVDAETMRVTKTEFEAPDFSYTDFEVIDYLYESGNNMYATVRFTIQDGTQNDVLYSGYMGEYTFKEDYEYEYKWRNIRTEPANEINRARGQYDPAQQAELIPNQSAQVLFWLRTQSRCYYFCSIRTLNSAANAYTDDPPKDFVIYYQQYDQNYFSVIDEPIPEEYPYDSIVPVLAITGEECISMRCILQLTDGDRTYYISYQAFEGIDQVYHPVSDDEIKALANMYPEIFGVIEENIKWTQYSETRTGEDGNIYQISFDLPAEWTYGSGGIFEDANGNKRIGSRYIAVDISKEDFVSSLEEMAEQYNVDLDSPLTGTSDSGIAYMGYCFEGEREIPGDITGRYLYRFTYSDSISMHMDVWKRNAYDDDSFYEQYVLPIIQSVTIRETGDHVDTITSLEDYKLLGPDFYESYYEYTRALIDGDTAKMEELSMYPEGTLDSYKDVRFTFKSVTREAETGRFILTAEVSEGHAVIPGGTQQFYYCEYPRRALVPILEPPAPNATEASAELSKLLNMTMKFNLDEMEVTEYVIDCLYRKTGKTNFTENEIVEYAKKCFGVDSFTPNEHFKRDGVYTSLAHGGNHIYHDVISTNYGDESGIYSVTVRFYADYAKTVYSHLIKYTMVKLDGDFSFLAQYIEEESPLKPFTHAT